MSEGGLKEKALILDKKWERAYSAWERFKEYHVKCNMCKVMCSGRLCKIFHQVTGKRFLKINAPGKSTFIDHLIICEECYKTMRNNMVKGQDDDTLNGWIGCKCSFYE